MACRLRARPKLQAKSVPQVARQLSRTYFTGTPVWSARVKRSGMNSGVIASKAAPVSETFRMVQVIFASPNWIAPALRTRLRVRCSIFAHGLSPQTGHTPDPN
jgi:hypothetical protein